MTETPDQPDREDEEQPAEPPAGAPEAGGMDEPAVEADAGETAFEERYGFWRAVGDGASLIARGILIALLAVLVGLIPAVGGVISTVFAVTFTGWLLADELTSRALTARGLASAERRTLRRRHRARVLGFGVATQLCFLVPLGAVVTMPAAVAGSTLLARSLLAPDAVRASRPARRAGSARASDAAPNAH